MNYLIGVDVGTSSARAAIFDVKGKKYAQAQKEIKTFSPQQGYFEQSSDDIWNSVCFAVKEAISLSEINIDDIIGLGFDATCSLVALDKEFTPSTISPTMNKRQNVILWMDHRATKQSRMINETKHDVLKYIGGKISPEMEIPKILWLKEGLKEAYDNISYYFDLPDFLTFKATGSQKRSACSTTCKWTYLNHKKDGWEKDFFNELDLKELLLGGKIGDDIIQVGEPIGSLSKNSAKELGLNRSVIVSSSIIDAHAGGVGVLGGKSSGVLSLITGTSACHMVCVKEKKFVKGVWGPYYGAMLPDLWLLEGGQSTAGALVDDVIKRSKIYEEVSRDAKKIGKNIYEFLNLHVEKLEKTNAFITEDYHTLGYFHGNRSPLSDATLKGIICGVQLNDNTMDSLAISYLSSLQSVAYGTRHIIESLRENGIQINTIRMCGGGTKNQLWLREHSDILQINIEIINESEAMLLGSAILSAYASGVYLTLSDAMKNMSSVKRIIKPNTKMANYHNAKYKVFRKMHGDFISYREMMQKDR